MIAVSNTVMRDLFNCSEQPNLVMLNLFQYNKPLPPVILKQVQDDEIGVGILNQVQDDETWAFSR